MRGSKACWAAAAFALLATSLSAGNARASSASVVTARLTASQRAAFLPLACRSPHKGKDGDTHCSALIGYPGEAEPDATLGFEAIAFGAFTAVGADEAYVTYDSSVEPHATNFGGGILFRRSGVAGWKLVRWYPGGQMDPCVGIPVSGRQQMLCLSGYTGQGITTTAVSQQSVPAPSGSSQNEIQRTFFLRGEDRRGIEPETETGCVSGVPSGQAWLLSIDGVAHSSRPGFFAQSKVTYETAADIRRACAGPHRSRVHETHGIVYFQVRDGNVRASTPAVFFKPLD